MADVIGRMDRRIRIETPVEARDGSGSLSRTWSPLATVHANVRRARGREFLAGGAMQDGGEIVFTVRWRDGITAGCRVAYAGAYYSVIGEPVEIGRRDRLEIKAMPVPAEDAQ